MESGWGGHGGAMSRSFACCRVWDQPLGTARVGQGEVAKGLSTRGTGCSPRRWDQPSRHTGNQHPLGTPQPHKTTWVFSKQLRAAPAAPEAIPSVPAAPTQPPAHLVGLALPLAGALRVHPEVGVQLVGADPQVPHPDRLQAQPGGDGGQQGQEQSRKHRLSPAELPPACVHPGSRAAKTPARHLAALCPAAKLGTNHIGWKGKKKYQKGGREDKEEEEMRSKPLWFSAPAACWLCGDAARHLRPSLSPQGDGDSIVRWWLSLAGVPVLPGGSLHAWHPEAVAVAAGPGSQHGGSGQWGWGAACVWGRGGRGGREGCNLNPLPSH